jgi:hypothetical protein
MKKYLLAAALVMVSTCALADGDEISCGGKSGCRVTSGTGKADNMADACKKAKRAAEDTVGRGMYGYEQVDSYTSCREGCAESRGQWSCAIDAKVLQK